MGAGRTIARTAGSSVEFVGLRPTNSTLEASDLLGTSS
jgi:hypothetical protein